MRAVKVESWRVEAACLGKDPELFFPEDEDGSKRAADMKAAKAICADCIVNAECLDYALRNNIEQGVWAGTSGNERRRLRRRRKAVA